jgi:hypothetical protein
MYFEHTFDYAIVDLSFVLPEFYMLPLTRGSQDQARGASRQGYQLNKCGIE